MKTFLSKNKPNVIFWNIFVILLITVPVIFSLPIFVLLQGVAVFTSFFFILDSLSENTFDGPIPKIYSGGFWMYFTLFYLLILFVYSIIWLGEKAITAFNNWFDGLFIKNK